MFTFLEFAFRLFFYILHLLENYMIQSMTFGKATIQLPTKKISRNKSLKQ
jgi:hypothetical protein